MKNVKFVINQSTAKRIARHISCKQNATPIGYRLKSVDSIKNGSQSIGLRPNTFER